MKHLHRYVTPVGPVRVDRLRHFQMMACDCGLTTERKVHP